MMSRLKYKGMKIESGVDECDQPLPKAKASAWKEPANLSKKKLDPMANRFQMLALDGAQEGSENGEEEDDLTSYTSTGGGVTWADSLVAV